MTDRREFINACAAGTAALLAPGAVLAAGSAGPAARRVSSETFESLLGEGMRCLGGPLGAVRLELTEMWRGPEVPGLDQFGLLLRGPDSARMPEGLYRLYHPRTGALTVHLAHSTARLDAYTTHFGLLA